MTNRVDAAEQLVYWSGQVVGTISNLGQNDMWYFDAEWHPESTSLAQEFEKTIAHLVGRTFFELKDAEQLVWVEIPSLNMSCTVVHAPIENRISLRLMISPKPLQS